MRSAHRSSLAGSEAWLGVQEASELLGVSTATLRRWSAAGLVEAFTTPGGHRRYAESTIRQLLARGAEPAAPTTASLGESTDRVNRLVREHLVPWCLTLSWVPRLSPGGRRLLACAGRAMVEGVLGHVDASTPQEAEVALGPALEAAAVHGRLAAEHGGGLCELLAGFHRFRGVLDDDVSELACQTGLTTAEATHLLARANDAVDRLIVAIVEAHSAAETQPQTNGAVCR